MSVIKRFKVQVLEGPPAPLSSAVASAPLIEGEAAEEEPERCEKVVRLHRLGGEVRALELSCSCGETTTIELGYDHPAPPSAPLAEASTAQEAAEEPA